MTPATRTPSRPAVFVQQLHRAAAQRGRLDPVYQDLSDHWTAVLQRLYPVWALIGPGLSDPGHIEIHSRTVYLDSDALLGPRAAIAAGALEQRAILRCFGVALHETLHAKHTKRWAIEHDIELSESDDPDDRQLAVDRRLLEEPRMEAHGVREFPPDSLRGRFVRRALQAAVIDVILPAFAEQVMAAAVAGQPLTRDLAARATVYLQARTHYGIVEPADARPAPRGVARGARRGKTSRRSTTCTPGSCGSPTASSTASTKPPATYRRIVGEPDPPPDRRGWRPAKPEKAGDRPVPATAAGEDVGDQARRAARVARRRARAGDRDRAAPDSSSSSTRTSTSGRCSSTPPPAANARASLAAGAGPGCRPAGCPTVASTDRRTPTRCSTPAGTPPGFARRSRRGRGRSTSAPPAGGSTDARTHAAAPSRPPGGRSTTHPWRVTRQVAAPIQEPHVGLIIDTSGSMAGYEYALGPIAWILTDGLRQIGGRCATALFGNSADAARRRHPTARARPGIRTGGGTAFAGDAIELVSDQLEMTNPRRPRFVYVLSDGGWSRHTRRRRADPRARRARRPDDPPQHRDRAAVGRVRPHHRDHRPRAGARPHRRRHRRRARAPGGADRAAPLTQPLSRKEAT